MWTLGSTWYPLGSQNFPRAPPGAQQVPKYYNCFIAFGSLFDVIVLRFLYVLCCHLFKIFILVHRPCSVREAFFLSSLCSLFSRDSGSSSLRRCPAPLVATGSGKRLRMQAAGGVFGGVPFRGRLEGESPRGGENGNHLGEGPQNVLPIVGTFLRFFEFLK